MVGKRHAHMQRHGETTDRRIIFAILIFQFHCGYTRHRIEARLLKWVKHVATRNTALGRLGWMIQVMHAALIEINYELHQTEFEISSKLHGLDDRSYAEMDEC
jgi:hypothetical protein